ncbi:MAG: ABC transporter permease [Patescibacteria group bacterium]|nr:ABC transporter permease [Patescibacteria group bacterium]
MKWHRIKALILRHLLIWPRNLEQITDTFYWPVLELLMWGFLTVYLIGNGLSRPSLVTFLLGSVMFWMIINQSQYQTSITFMHEVWDRNLLNIFSSPVSPWEFVLAALIISLIKFLITLVILVLAAYFLYAFNIFSLGWYFIPFLFSLSLMGWVAGIFITGLIVRMGQGASSFAWTLLSILQPFSAVFYPLSTLPDWAQKIGLLLPSTYVFEGMRSVLARGSMNVNYLIISFALNIFYLILALLFYKWMFKVAMEKGLLTKFN